MLARYAERTRLDAALDHIRHGHSAALVLDGKAGIGKTTLLRYVTERADGFTLLTATGTQSEVEIAHAALHQVCRPLLDGALAQLPPPQREALETTFGLRAGPFPGTFLVGLAVLSLMSEASRTQPVLCVLDDAQWMDQASADVLGFVARRLDAEAVGMVFATRSSPDVSRFEGIPRLTVVGLDEVAARQLLASLTPGRIDPSSMKRIIDEADGNPLIIVESARALNRAEIETGIILTDLSADPSQLEEHFGRRLEALPEETRRLLLIAAAEPLADPQIIRAAAAAVGIRNDAVNAAADAGLCHPGPMVRFRHPLVRSAAYRTASPAAIRAAHAALAGIELEESDPDLITWHRARACETTDEEIASELAAVAARVFARGAPAASAALLRQAQQVTADPSLKAEWSLRIAQAELAAGDFEGASRALSGSTTLRLTPGLRAEAKLTEARLAFVRERGGTAVPLLLEAADQLTAVNPDAAPDAYLEAFSAALFGGSLAHADLAEVARRWSAADVPTGDGPAQRVLDALTPVVSGGTRSDWQQVREVLSSLSGDDDRAGPRVASLWVACVAASAGWDIEAWDLLSQRLVASGRASGDFSELPPALSTRAFVHLFTGDLRSASEMVEEMATITSATAGRISPYGAIGITALRGGDADLTGLVDVTIPDAERRSDATGISISCWAAALLNNSMGRYERALSWALRARPLYHPLLASSVWAPVELIEAASRTNRPEDGRIGLEQLALATEPSGTAWGLGVLARSRGLLTDGDAAEDHFAESLHLLEQTPCRLDVARTSLVYGEWLRRRRRLSDSRTHLSRAVHLFESIGAKAFTARSTRELRAAGAQIRKPATATATSVLTAQESQIAKLVAQGLSNDEVATRVFLSPRTVEYHLSKVFGKLQLSSRHQLAAVPADALEGRP